MHLFIGVEEVWRDAQTYSGTAIDEDFSFTQTFHHRWAIVDTDHDRAAAFVDVARSVHLPATFERILDHPFSPAPRFARDCFNADFGYDLQAGQRRVERGNTRRALRK